MEQEAGGIIAPMTEPSGEPISDDLRCPHCSYNLRGLTSRRCPECGTGFDPHILRHQFPPRPSPVWRKLIWAMALAPVLIAGAGLLASQAIKTQPPGRAILMTVFAVVVPGLVGLVWHARVLAHVDANRGADERPAVWGAESFNERWAVLIALELFYALLTGLPAGFLVTTLAFIIG